jgi:hypothetical protein
MSRSFLESLNIEFLNFKLVSGSVNLNNVKHRPSGSLR